MRTFVDAFRFIGDHPHLLLVKSSQTLELAAAALGIALLLALPIGLWLGHLHRGLFAAASVSNVGRALPSLVLIAFGLTVFGIGFWNNTVALVVLAIPPVLTNAYFAVDGVDRDVVDAARGMGMTEAQVLRRVELPLALPLILAGVRISASGGGLGDVIVNRATYGNAGVVAASLCVSALAFAASLIVSFVKRAGSPRPTLVP